MPPAGTVGTCAAASAAGIIHADSERIRPVDTAPGEQDTTEFSRMLAGFRDGDGAAERQLIALVHADLRRLARRSLAGSRWMSTLDTTSLVNESYLRLVSPAARHVQTRSHFFNLAARAMRQIVCDYARKRLRATRDAETAAAEAADDPTLFQARQFTRIDEALQDLARIAPRQARVVECRFFAGLTDEETAEALATSVRTVQREWSDARRWLQAQLQS
jgi:RNA polymerase sigma factor (TIGR02999 family)